MIQCGTDLEKQTQMAVGSHQWTVAGRTNKANVPTGGISQCASILSFHHRIHWQLRETNLIWVRSLQCEVSSVRMDKAVIWTSDFTLYTSNSAEGRSDCGCGALRVGG